jgi:hypothetical protein
MAVGWAPDRKAGEPPLRVESREELVYLLGEACELEHGLLCQYLYAQFSLKRSVDEGVTPEQLARIQTWEKTIIDISKQEMLHLALATNILTALGAAPHFDRPISRSSLAGTPPTFRSRCLLSGSGRYATSCTWKGRRACRSKMRRGLPRSIPWRPCLPPTRS